MRPAPSDDPNSESSLSKSGKLPETYDPAREGLKPYDYEDYWDAPEKYWRKVPITEAEMALVEVRPVAGTRTSGLGVYARHRVEGR
jgi:hypothetical protein